MHYYAEVWQAVIIILTCIIILGQLDTKLDEYLVSGLKIKQQTQTRRDTVWLLLIILGGVIIGQLMPDGNLWFSVMCVTVGAIITGALWSIVSVFWIYHRTVKDRSGEDQPE